jgi:hypothetical protein
LRRAYALVPALAIGSVVVAAAGSDTTPDLDAPASLSVVAAGAKSG